MNNAVSKTEDIQRKLEEVLRENESLRRQNEDLKKKNTDLQTETDDLKRKTADLQTETDDLKRKTADLQTETDDLKRKTADLQAETDDLKKKTADLQEDLSAAEANLKLTEEKLRRALKRLFGSSSEHVARDGDMYEQLSFVFNEAELISDTEPLPEETVEVKGHKRKRIKSGSIEDIIPDDAPVEIIEYRPDSITCAECGSEMEEIGKEIRRTLVLVRKHYKVREERFYKYACKVCNDTGTETPVAEPDRPPALLPGSYASPEAVANIMYEKFVMYSPLYRQEQDWQRAGLKLSRQTMSHWLITCAEQYFRPVYEELRLKLLEAELIHADETPLQVLHEPDRRAKSKSYMWLYMTGRYAKEQIVLYNYNESRSGSVPKAFLAGYSGYLQTDGYSGYNILSSAKRIGCLAHARRYFTDALNGMKEHERKGSVAEEGFDRIEKILLEEKKLVDLTPEYRLKQRLSVIKPLMDDLFAWVNTVQILKGRARDGITYLRNQRSTFTPYFADGRIELTNNRAERSIKPFVMGRKNFLFCNTPRGAKASEVIYSLIETARSNALDPYEYLLYVLKTAPNFSGSDITVLLPWNAPVSCRKIESETN